MLQSLLPLTDDSNTYVLIYCMRACAWCSTLLIVRRWSSIALHNPLTQIYSILAAYHTYLLVICIFRQSPFRLAELFGVFDGRLPRHLVCLDYTDGRGSCIQKPLMSDKSLAPSMKDHPVFGAMCSAAVLLQKTWRRGVPNKEFEG